MLVLVLVVHCCAVAVVVVVVAARCAAWVAIMGIAMAHVIVG